MVTTEFKRVPLRPDLTVYVLLSGYLCSTLTQTHTIHTDTVGGDGGGFRVGDLLS